MTAVTDEQVVADRLDLEMIERPHLWPRRPFLYLKRPVAGRVWPQVARCVRREDGSYFVKVDFETDSITYANAEAIVADGWKVD